MRSLRPMTQEEREFAEQEHDLVISFLCRRYLPTDNFYDRLRMEELVMKVKAYIHSLKDHEHDRHVLGEAEIIKQISDDLYLAEVNGVRCTAIFNFFTGRYYVDDVYGVRAEA